MVFRNILFLIFTLYSCESNGIVLTQYPPSKVDIGSSQIISWKSPVVLDSVSIDLYQRSQFKQNLGQTNQNLNNLMINCFLYIVRCILISIDYKNNKILKEWMLLVEDSMKDMGREKYKASLGQNIFTEYLCSNKIRL